MRSTSILLQDGLVRSLGTYAIPLLFIQDVSFVPT